MSLIAILTPSSGRGQSIPFDDTIAWNIDTQINNDPDYHFSGGYARNPINGRIIHFFRFGTGHVWDVTSKASAKLSTDRGVTFGSIYDLYDPSSPFAVIAVCGGYDISAKLHLFAVRGNSDQSSVFMQYFTSTDEVTITTPIALSVPSDGHDSFQFQGDMIENNGILMFPFYTFELPDPFTGSGNYMYRSTDGGSNWSIITVRSFAATYFNEASTIALDNSNLIMLIRDEVNRGFQQYSSDDNGLTWSSDGNVKFGDSWGSRSSPPTLKRFNINGIRVIACYFFNRATEDYKVIYGKASNLLSGVSGWDEDTKITLTNIAGFNRSGYQGVAHFDNTLEAKGEIYEDGNLAYTETYYYTLPTTQYNSLITELGL